jgi:hypothetical protein
MAKISHTVDGKIKELYAVLAKAAAQRAVDHVVGCPDPRGADKFIDATIHWLSLTSAEQARWVYDRPRIKS